MLREIKPRTARSARALAKQAPQVNENPKKALFLKSTSTSSLANTISKDLYALKKPLAVRFEKKNAVHPFEDPSSLEFFSQKNDTSLMCFTSHSKKRPHCLTFARFFDGKILDILECLILQDSARSLNQFGGQKARVGVKPLLSFSGSQFDDEDTEHGAESKFKLAKSMFTDFFRGEDATEVDVEGLQTLITFTASEEKAGEFGTKEMVHMRVWRLVSKKSGQKLPRVEVEEMGPRVDFRLGRIQIADDQMMKEALKSRKPSEPKTKKNISMDEMGDKTGQLHITPQTFNNLQTRKMKGLKRDREAEAPGSGEQLGDDQMSVDSMEDGENADGSKPHHKRQKSDHDMS